MQGIDQKRAKYRKLDQEWYAEKQEDKKGQKRKASAN